MKIEEKDSFFGVHSKILGPNDFYQKKSKSGDKYDLDVKISKIALNPLSPELAESNVVGCKGSEACNYTRGNCSDNCCHSVCSSC